MISIFFYRKEKQKPTIVAEWRQLINHCATNVNNGKKLKSSYLKKKNISKIQFFINKVKSCMFEAFMTREIITRCCFRNFLEKYLNYLKSKLY